MCRYLVPDRCDHPLVPPVNGLGQILKSHLVAIKIMAMMMMTTMIIMVRGAVPGCCFSLTSLLRGSEGPWGNETRPLA